MPVELGVEESIGVFVVGDFFKSQETDQSFLEGIKATFDFAFGGRIGGDAVIGAQGGESALELGMGVEPVSGGAMAKEGEAVGIKTGWQAVGFDGPAQMLEMIPSGVAADEGTGNDFAGVIIQGEDQHRIMVGRPPGMRRTVVLPELADGAGLPAAARFGARRRRGGLKGKVLADIGGNRGPGTVELVTTGQLVSQQRKIKRLAMGQEVLEKIMDGLGPGCFMVAARRSQLEAGAILKPLVAQFVESSRTDH